MKLFILIFCIAVFAISCAPRNPVTKVNALDSRPTLSFKNVLEGSVLFIDGIDMGSPAQFNGKPKVLSVLPGTHEVVVKKADRIIYQQTIFVESEHKEINIH
jgi:hypothetical protein